MEKQQKMPLIYGYLVCLVSVITFLICVSTLLYAILDLNDPIHAGFNPPGSPSLASFDNYKMDILKSIAGKESSEKAYVPDDQTLHSMYEAAKNDKIQNILHDSHRTIVVDAILIVICIVLFATHWKWMRNLQKIETQ